MNTNNLLACESSVLNSGSTILVRLIFKSFSSKYELHKVETMAFVPSDSNMTHPDQWGAHDQTHDGSGPGPYTKNPLPGPAYDQRNVDTGASVYEVRFKPKARIKDPLFLVIFVAQVLYHTIPSAFYRTHERPNRHDSTDSSSPSCTS